MTNNIYSPARRLLTCLLALLCLFSIGAAGGLHAWADETEEAGSGTEAAVSGQRVDPVNLEADCSLKVYPISTSSEFAEDLKTNASMIVDVYRVADAVPVAGVDMYGYQFVSPFNVKAVLDIAAAGMDLRTEDGAYVPNESMTNEIWSSISQAAAKIVKADFSFVPAVSSEKAKGEEYAAVPAAPAEGEASSALETGLYLLVVHTDAVKYWNEEKAGEPLTTRVVSDTYLYSYAPQIVTLPYKSAQMQPYVEGSPIKTSDNTPWAYDLSVYLKAERQTRYADLTLTKTLQKYHLKTPVEVIFYVNAYDNPDEPPIYSKAYSIKFYGNGTKQRKALKVPIGSTVVITESYPGPDCKQVVPANNEGYTGIMTENGLSVDGTLTNVHFVNEGNGPNGGGGIENTYTYEESLSPSSEGAWNAGEQNENPGTPVDVQ